MNNHTDQDLTPAAEADTASASLIGGKPTNSLKSYWEEKVSLQQLLKNSAAGVSTWILTAALTKPFCMKQIPGDTRGVMAFLKSMCDNKFDPAICRQAFEWAQKETFPLAADAPFPQVPLNLTRIACTTNADPANETLCLSSVLEFMTAMLEVKHGTNAHGTHMDEHALSMWGTIFLLSMICQFLYLTSIHALNYHDAYNKLTHIMLPLLAWTLVLGCLISTQTPSNPPLLSPENDPRINMGQYTSCSVERGETNTSTCITGAYEGANAAASLAPGEYCETDGFPEYTNPYKQAWCNSSCNGWQTGVYQRLPMIYMNACLYQHDPVSQSIWAAFLFLAVNALVMPLPKEYDWRSSLPKRCNDWCSTLWGKAQQSYSRQKRTGYQLTEEHRAPSDPSARYITTN